jgi:hypothetical protein
MQIYFIIESLVLWAGVFTFPVDTSYMFLYIAHNLKSGQWLLNAGCYKPGQPI